MRKKIDSTSAMCVVTSRFSFARKYLDVLKRDKPDISALFPHSSNLMINLRTFIFGLSYKDFMRLICVDLLNIFMSEKTR